MNKLPNEDKWSHIYLTKGLLNLTFTALRQKSAKHSKNLIHQISIISSIYLK